MLGLDSAQFDTGLKKAQSGLSGFGKNAAIAGAAVGAAMAGAAIALGGAVKGALDRADEMSKAAQKFGVPIEELSRLSHAADLSDVSLQQLGTGLGKLSKAMADAAGKGTSGAAKALQSLGISAVDASGKLRPTSDVMEDVAGKFAGMEDGAGKTALAMAIFGKSGADLIPLLNSGKDGLAEMGAEADALGLTLDEKTGKAAEAFNDNLTRLQAAGKGITTQLAARLAPALETVSGVLVDAAKDTQLMDAIGKALTFTLKGMATAAVAIATAFKLAGSNIATIAKAFQQVITGDFKGAFDTVRAGFKSNVDGMAGAVSQIQKIWNSTGSAVAARAPAVSDQIASPAVQAGKKIKAAAAAAKPEVEKLGDALADLQERLKTSSEKGAEQLRKDLLTLNTALFEGRVTAEEYNEAVARLNPTVVDLGDAVKPLSADITTTEEAMADLADQMDAAEEPGRALLDVFDRMSGAFDNLISGLKRGNLRGLVSDFRAIKETFRDFGKLDINGKISAIAGAAEGIGAAIGGKAGRAISSAGSGALLGLEIGGPIGAGIGAVLGGLSALLGGKPSNRGAGFDLRDGRVSGKSRDADTEAAAVGTGKVILQMQAALKKLGATLSTTVNGLVIGARDVSQIYLSDGRTLTSAIGDAGAATETALHAVLQAAEFADAAQKELVKSMLEAGESALDIVDAPAAAADEKAAKAAAVVAQRRELEIRLMEASGDALGALNARRADDRAAIDETNRALFDQVNAAADAADAVAAARANLADAIGREKDELTDFASRFDALGSSLRDFSASLRAANDNNLKDVGAEFAKVAGAARGGDEKALGELQGVGERLIDLSRITAKSDFEARKVNAQVRIATDAAAGAAENQAGMAKMQIAKLDLQLGVLTGIQTNGLNIHAALIEFNASIQAQAQATTAAVSGVMAAQAMTAGSIEALRAEQQAFQVQLLQYARVQANTLQRWEGDGQPPVREEAA